MNYRNPPWKAGRTNGTQTTSTGVCGTRQTLKYRRLCRFSYFWDQKQIFQLNLILS